MGLNYTEDRMDLDKVVEDSSEIFVLAIVEWVNAFHTLPTTYESNSLLSVGRAYWKLPFLLPEFLYALMMNGFGIESIIAHNPMPLLLSIPLIPWLFHPHNIVTKVAHCMRSTCSGCTKANSWMSLIPENVENH